MTLQVSVMDQFLPIFNIKVRLVDSQFFAFLLFSPEQFQFIYSLNLSLGQRDQHYL